MSEHRGEFEQRPEVRPADYRVPERRRNNPIVSVLCVIFALSTFGLGGYVVYTNLFGSKTTETQCVAEAIEEKPSKEKTAFEYSENVHDIMMELYKDARTISGDVEIFSNPKYITYVNVAEGIYLGSDRAHTVFFNMTSDSIRKEHEALKLKVEEFIREHNLSRITNATTATVFSNNDGLFCSFEYTTFYITCAHKSSINPNKEAIAKEIGKLELDNNKSKNEVLFHEIDDVVTNGSYEVVRVWSDGLEVYYRKKKDEKSTWKYALGGQTPDSCDSINDEAKEAVKNLGFFCLDETNSVEKL